MPTQVNYVSKAVNLYQNGYDLHGSTYVVEMYLGDTWLWDQVRVLGGAMGDFASFILNREILLSLATEIPTSSLPFGLTMALAAI